MTTISVNTASQLMSALGNAKAGDTISLAAGNYGAIRIDNRKFASGVTIVSASANNQAHLDSLQVKTSSNLTFKNIDIGGSANVLNSTVKTFVANSDHITFDSVHVHGTLDDNAQNDASGIRFLDSSFVTVKNSEFEQLLRGAMFSKSNNITFSGNNVHDIRMDGSIFNQVKNVVIDGNFYTDFDRISTDHSDAIQFWTTGTTTASTDITIRNNQILQGDGTAMQGIFMKDEIGKLPYQRVTIENNLIYESGYANGLTVDGGKSIVVKDNTVISSSAKAGSTKIRMEGVNGVQLIDNVSDQTIWLDKNSGIVQSGNVELDKTPSKRSQIEDIALGASADAEDLVMNGVGYEYKPIGSVNGSSAPSAPTQPPVTSAPAPSAPAPSNPAPSAPAVPPVFTPPTLGDTIDVPTAPATPQTGSQVIVSGASNTLFSAQVNNFFQQLYSSH